MKNQNVDFEENTYKQYYFPLSDVDDDDNSPPSYSNKRTADESLDEFFAVPKKKKEKVCSSTVARSTADGMSYISTNSDDATTATHLIKIDIYDMKKIVNIDPAEHWQNADVRVKYYFNKGNNNYHQRTRGLIYNITKEISNSADCKKYTIKRQQHPSVGPKSNVRWSSV